MHEFFVHTLVDITENGNLQKTFPFQTKADETVDSKDTLKIAKNQNNNFNTMLQLLQIRGNVVWEKPPVRIQNTLGNSGFGSAYEGTHMSWHFQFFTEQSDVYGDVTNPIGQLLDDFNLVPIVNFCKETANFPIATFITKNLTQPTINPVTDKQKVINALSGDIINTYFSYAGYSNK